MQHPLVRPSLAPYAFAYPQFTNRLDYKDKFNPFWTNAERLMAKFWDRRHRLDAPDPLPIETIIHRILPGQAQANRLREREFEFRGFPYISRDIVLLSSILYWFGSNVGSCFLEMPPIYDWRPESRQLPPLKPWLQKLKRHPEREFLFKFELKARERDMVAFWGHQCTSHCSQKQVMFSPFVSPHAYDSRAITPRDRAVAEGLMRWLGRAEGRGFIADWLAYLKRARQQADVRRERDFKQRQLVSAAA